jgi:hypothetical protein
MKRWSEKTWAERTLLNWRFWLVLPVTMGMLPLALVSLIVPLRAGWYSRLVNWQHYR